MRKYISIVLLAGLSFGCAGRVYTSPPPNVVGVSVSDGRGYRFPASTSRYVFTNGIAGVQGDSGSLMACSIGGFKTAGLVPTGSKCIVFMKFRGIYSKDETITLDFWSLTSNGQRGKHLGARHIQVTVSHRAQGWAETITWLKRPVQYERRVRKRY